MNITKITVWQLDLPLHKPYYLSGGRLRFDRGGRLAERGRVDRALVSELLRDPYFRRRPPKATGREAFGERFARAFETRARARGARGADLVATATAPTYCRLRRDQYYTATEFSRADLDTFVDLMVDQNRDSYRVCR